MNIDNKYRERVLADLKGLHTDTLSALDEIEDNGVDSMARDFQPIVMATAIQDLGTVTAVLIERIWELEEQLAPHVKIARAEEPTEYDGFAQGA